MIIIIKYQNLLRAYYVPDPGQELYKYNLIWNLQQAYDDCAINFIL